MQDNVFELTAYVRGLLDGKSSAELYHLHHEVFEKVSPMQVFRAFTYLLREGYTEEQILKVLSKPMTLLSNHLPEFDAGSLPDDHFLKLLINENEKTAGVLDEKKTRVGKEDGQAILQELSILLKEYESHSLVKENILFPYMEKKDSIYAGTSIMWGLHDTVRQLAKRAGEQISGDEAKKLIGEIYFAVYGLIEKENILLFPAAYEIFDEREFAEMARQAKDYGYDVEDNVSLDLPGEIKDLRYASSSGELSFDQLTLILNSLPVDISYVDENDILRYFNTPTERIFPRSPAAIGRNVRNCHPPKSYDAVERIIRDFRSGESDREVFWIDMKGKKILIEYYALRDSQGNYRGVLEASRDISGMMELKGEKRL